MKSIQTFKAKLKPVKTQLKTLHQQCTSHISRRVKEVTKKWGEAQRELELHPHSSPHAAEEHALAKLHTQLTMEDESL